MKSGNVAEDNSLRCS